MRDHAPDTERPRWLRDSAETADITDVWQEATDPENERGEVVTAHYAITLQPVDGESPFAERRAPWRDLIGASVEGAGTTYRSRFDLTRAGVKCTDLEGWCEEAA